MIIYKQRDHEIFIFTSSRVVIINYVIAISEKKYTFSFRLI